MADFAIEQALFRREHEQAPLLSARSAGFADEWLPDAERLILAFGERSGGLTCKHAVFANPLNDHHVAVVQVADQEAGANGWPVLGFWVAVVAREHWRLYLGDPFAFAARLPPTWNARGELPTVSWPQTPLPPRRIGEVQAVLQRIKAHALREDEDPEAEIERTVENSESPALLGGAQVLVDGGKLVFRRTAPDNDLVQGLWTLLPNSLRPIIWPASFAFSNALRFDVVVVPRAGEENWEGYTTEDQAADYPAGAYEMALQSAAEAGDQAEMDAVFTRRTSNETLRLAVAILVFLSLLVLAGKLFTPTPPVRFTPQRKVMVAAGTVAAASGDPWSALSMLQAGQRLFEQDKEKTQ